MTGESPIRVGVIGLGLMGRTHLSAYEAAQRSGLPCRVVAVCDRNAERLAAFEGVARHKSAERLLAAGVDLVSVCTRTDSHVAIAHAALDAGAHVLVEKPVALTAGGLSPLLSSPRRAALMPAFCMRFWPGWSLLLDAVRDQRFGRVRSATFQRLSAPPDWSPEFYGNSSLSGGALVDLHVHDADVIRWLFGEPAEVVSTGSLDHVTTLYRFAGADPVHVTAEGGWNHAPGFPFRMRYVVVFDDATLDYDLGRDPRLQVARGGRVDPVAVPEGAGYEPMIRHAVAWSLARETPSVTLDDAAQVARILDAERESLATGRGVRLIR